MPSLNNGDPNVGMQIWVDLPKSLKFCEPRYRDLRAGEIPLDTSEDGKVAIKVIAGQTKNGILSQQNLSYTPVWLLDVTIKPGGKFVQPLPRHWNSYAYTIEGSAVFGIGEDAKKADRFHMTVFESSGDRVVAEVPADATEDVRFILAAGLPLNQAIVQYGPFVSTSNEGIYDAMRDFQSYTNGFENARGFQSEIGKRLTF